MAHLQEHVTLHGNVVVDPVHAAILHVDIETGFMPDHPWTSCTGKERIIGGGGLAVKLGHQVVPVALQNTSYFPDDRRYASVDVHPYGHIGYYTSFLSPDDRYLPLEPFYYLTKESIAGWDNSMILSPYFEIEYLKYYVRHAKGGGQMAWWEHCPMGSDQSLLHPAMRHLHFRMILSKGADPKVDSYSPMEDNLGRSTGLSEAMEDHGVRDLFIDGLALDYCVGFAALAAKAKGFNVYVILDATRSVAPESETSMLALLKAAGVHLILSSQLVRV